MSLEKWLALSWLKRHETSAQEIADILAMVDRDLAEAANQSISPDWRLNIAFNAALQSANAALYASGYRTIGEGHHERVITSLEYTIKAPDVLIRQLNRFRTKRIKTTYDKAGTTSDQEAGEVLKLASDIRDMVRDWLKRIHPELLK